MINLVTIWDLIKSFLPSKNEAKRDQTRVDGNKNITIINNNIIINYNISNNYFEQENIKSEYNKNKNK